jgi:hypothetical protein
MLERVVRVVGRFYGTLFFVMVMGKSSITKAEPKDTARATVDKAVVRFSAPETGGVRFPRFIFERELSFEARLEALTDSEFVKGSDRPYLERHLQAALERFIAETLLASLRVDPNPTEALIAAQASAARNLLLDRIGGADVLDKTARIEGMSEGDVSAVFRRRARAAIYLDQMVSPMLSPSNVELRQLYATEPHPYRSLPFDKALPLLRRWVVGRRIREAFEQYYQNARQRLQIVILSKGNGES